ncbi:hypothetical protein KX729_17790 [Rhizobium sp. XQZ8]|uniref:EF-hand domain-containing protein n=1 Tax=Rhizobium populisoli TaxID=2859785 RepID=UPI001CA4BA88|nr:EF-hand domain-containing protein [Rhizobium populisoli]MBW6423312.1 hypothetical protein [Rhizobium populisoli]
MTAKKIVIATLGAALIAGAAIPAFAAPGRGGPDRGHMGPMGGRGVMQDVMFVRLLKAADTNKDGKVTKDEMTAFQDKLFTEIDANKDGSLTRGEMLDYRQAKMEEFRKNNPPPAIANTADNKDQAKPDDQNKMADQRGDHRRDRDRDHAGWGRHGDRDGWGRHEARWDRHDRDGRPMMRGGMFRMLDEDRDGKVTKAEATAAGDKLFARMDTNKDGTISIDDLPDRPL